MSSSRRHLAVVIEAVSDSGSYEAGGRGKALRAGLESQHLQADLITAAVPCDCNFKARRKAAQHCKDRVRHELEGYENIIALGSAALGSVRGRPAAIQKWRGSVFRDGDRTIFPILDAGDATRIERFVSVWQGDWARIGRVMRDGFVAPEDSRVILIPQTVAELHAALSQLRGDAVGLDVETVGLGPTATDLVCVGLSDGEVTIVVPWSEKADGRGCVWSDPAAVAAAVSEVLLPRIMVTHNGPGFDHLVLERYGFKWDRWDDTMGMSHALRGHMPKNLAWVVTTAGGGCIDVGPWKQLEDRGVDITRLHVYNARDTLYMMLAYRELLKEFR